MLRRPCQLAFLLLGLVCGGCLVANAQATLEGITYEPMEPGVGEQVCFTAEITGDPDWFVLYEWDFDQDGHTDAVGRMACHVFQAEGQKVVTVRATDDRGSVHSQEQLLYVVDQDPTASFTYTPTFPAVGAPVYFDASGSSDPEGIITRYEWDFNNDGTVDATGLTARHAFTSAGQHQVKLTVVDGGGNEDSDLQIISAQPIPPTACFSSEPLAPTVYSEVEFDARCSVDPDGGPIVLYQWSFGDGETANGAQPSHMYESGGAYEVCLTITDNDQQTNTVCSTVVVGGPSAAFSYAPLNPTTQDEVQFFDQSSDPTSDIETWSWSFGDGGDSNARNPKHTFASPGPHQITLTVTSERGAIASATRTINVRNAPPTASFTFTPATPDLGEMVVFSATGSNDPDGSIVLYEWDFNNDGITDVTGTTATRAFSTVGARPVSLRVTDDKGAESTVVKVVPVQASPPTACFSFEPADPVTGESISFDASCSADSDGTVILYEWDLDDDGVTDATGMVVTHSFPSAGTYSVTLTVTDNDGAVDASTHAVPVSTGGTSGDNQPPTPDFTVSFEDGDEANIGEVVTFQSEGSSDADGTIVSYEWDFDDDGVYDATGTTAAHVYQTGGAKIVTLRATDDDGAHGFKTRVVSVGFVRPTAAFTFTPAQPMNGEVVQFDASDSSDRDGTVEFFEWDFNDDGRTDATGMTVTHVFASGGAKKVTLTVFDDDGVEDFTTRTVPVEQNNPPTADFEFSPLVRDDDPAAPANAVAVGVNIAFESTSEDPDGQIVAYLWDFGDDSATTDSPSPKHKFTEIGTYTVTLVVTDDGGDTGEKTQTIIVVTPPEPDNDVEVDFSWSPRNPDVNEEVQFTDESTDPDGAITSWEWDYGDESAKGAQRNPKHSYSEEGTYRVTLTVQVSRGDTPAAKTYWVTVGPPRVVAYPNPASSSVTMDTGFFGTGASDVIVTVFDLAGDLVLEESLGTSTDFEWDLVDRFGAQVANGLYFVVATATVDGRTERSAVFRLLVRRR